VVGADGTRSVVRQALGIRMQRLGEIGEFVNTLFTANLDGMLGDRRFALYVITHPDATESSSGSATVGGASSGNGSPSADSHPRTSPRTAASTSSGPPSGRRAKSFLLVSGCLTDAQLVGAGGRVAWCSE
jgi:hypothetical protein